MAFQFLTCQSRCEFFLHESQNVLNSKLCMSIDVLYLEEEKENTYMCKFLHVKCQKLAETLLKTHKSFRVKVRLWSILDYDPLVINGNTIQERAKYHHSHTLFSQSKPCFCTANAQVNCMDGCIFLRVLNSEHNCKRAFVAGRAGRQKTLCGKWTLYPQE